MENQPTVEERALIRKAFAHLTDCGASCTSVVHLACHFLHHAAGDARAGVAGRLGGQVVGIPVQDHGVADDGALARGDGDRVRGEGGAHGAAGVGGDVAEVAGVVRDRVGRAVRTCSSLTADLLGRAYGAGGRVEGLERRRARERAAELLFALAILFRRVGGVLAEEFRALFRGKAGRGALAEVVGHF